MTETIPVVLFAYARPRRLLMTLECLRANHVPLIYAFADGPKTSQDSQKVASVREILRAIDWCEVALCERERNLGLGRSIFTGVQTVLEKHDTIIVFEDDLVCVPGAYNYLSAALKHYANNPAVMSVTGWTHRLVTPGAVNGQPYFDGRAECLAWGTWARAWQRMDRDAMTLISECRTRGIDVFRYGADLPSQARKERARNLWAVRWLYAHLLSGGLCMRPPHSLVDHVGFDDEATNAMDPWKWSNHPLKDCPLVPQEWPVPEERPECSRLWRSVYGANSLEWFVKRAVRKSRFLVRRTLQPLVGD
ncbi:MAG: hypothetical protein FJ118_19420 [Deltaproteobacteria bacterium]|nr:hypothetical protein [Deltaproteobacteria bacterium]